MIPAYGANFTVWGSHRTHCKCCNVCVKNYRICKIILQLYLSAWCQITPLTKTRTESENSIWPILGIPDLVLVHFGNSWFGPDGWSHHRLLCFITNIKQNTAGLSARWPADASCQFCNFTGNNPQILLGPILNRSKLCAAQFPETSIKVKILKRIFQWNRDKKILLSIK